MQTASNSVFQVLRTLTAPGPWAALLAIATLLTEVGVDGVEIWRAGAPVRPEDILVPAVSVVALLVTLWLASAVVLELLARLPGAVGRCAGSTAGLLTPRQLRRFIAALLGLGITAGLAQSASAVAVRPTFAAPTPLPLSADRSLPDPGVGSLPDPGWVPSVPVVRPQPDVRVLSPVPRDEPRARPPHHVVVHRGDCLWAIAARHLGPNASDAEIAQAWPEWYAANRDIVGPDPDLLLPGQVLRVPSREAS